MPDLNEFFTPKNNYKPYELEKLPGVRACQRCDEDVNGALWDPIELVMSWTCSRGHETKFEIQ